MRINKFIALATGKSRRAADKLIEAGRVKVDGKPPEQGQQVDENQVVTVDNDRVGLPSYHTILLHKPVGYVCSRDGQGASTIYELLPKELHGLKPVGRLDKDSSGLLLLTNDGDRAHSLTHPSFQKTKIYQVTLDKPLQKDDAQRIQTKGVDIGDYTSTFDLGQLEARTHWQVTMHEGKNRQIRRTFEALGYKVTSLHRTQFGAYKLQEIPEGDYTISEN